GKFFFPGDDRKEVTIYESDSLSEISTFKGHLKYITDIKFMPDGKSVFSGGFDGTMRLWDINTGKEIAQFITFKDGEWIVITPEGYYNSSANGDKHLNVSIGNRVYGIDQYRTTFYKPRIVEAVLRGVDIEDAVARVSGEHKEALSAAHTEPPFVVIKSPEDGKKINSTDAEISLYIEDRNQTIKKVKVFVNGRVAAGAEGRGIKVTGTVPEGKKALELKIPVQLDVGENLIEVTAFNGFSEGRKSIHVYSSAARAKDKVMLPNLWILSIGINRYQDKKLPSLSYAASDAEGIVKAFSGQKGKLFRVKPTYENIIDNLNYLSRAGHNDVAMLFIAGHGMNDDRGEFYFLPSDAFIKDDGTIKRSRAISWREIKSILDIPAKKLLFADTCHSEGISGKKTRGVDSDRFVKELQEANAVIFTSSRGRELSQESDRWKHGAFTYALIQGIKGKADLIRDNKISMKELDAYVSETVPKITNGAQHPITNTPDGYVNFPVAIVK
ncbi:MAG: caspase family protein, partial [Deltaproteobacteria bacterium]|nr:caspase family protein [Deltaproteobacteria bacterium]